MAFKNWEELQQAIQSSGQSWSDADRQRAQGDMDYGNSIYTLKNDWTKAWQAGDKEGAAAIHDRTEDFRKKYGGYSGGADGAGYVKDSTYFRYDDPYQDTLSQLADELTGYNKFTNPYQGQTDAVLKEYLDRGPFSYDFDNPIWKQYQKTYLREGQRAREDTLGNYAAATGGMASTAAVNAASQAQDYYNAQMADKIPELYQLAWDMYQGQGNDYLNQINALRGLGSDALNEWDANRGLLLDQIAGVQGISDDRYNRAYQQHVLDYQADRDSLDDTRYREETDYNRTQNAQAQAREQALQWLAMGVTPSDSVIEASGLDQSDIASYLAAMQAQAAGSGSSGKSSGSSRSSGSSSGGSASDSSDIYAALMGAGATDYGTAYDYLRSNGYGTTDANRYAKYFAETYYPKQNRQKSTVKTGPLTAGEGPVKLSTPTEVSQTLLNGAIGNTAVSAVLDQLESGKITQEDAQKQIKKLMGMY